jgi:hypothetical protein
MSHDELEVVNVSKSVVSNEQGEEHFPVNDSPFTI